MPGYVQSLKASDSDYHCVQLAGSPGQGAIRKALVELMAAQKLDFLLVPMVREASLHLSRKMEAALSPSSATTAPDY